MKTKKLSLLIKTLLIIINYKSLICYSTNVNSFNNEILSSITSEDITTYVSIKGTFGNKDKIKKYKNEIKDILSQEDIYLKESRFNDLYENLEAANLYINYDSKYSFNLFISMKGYNEEKINKLVQKIEKSLSSIKSNIKINFNIKAKLKNNIEIETEKNKVEDNLNNKGYILETIKLSNAYSTKVSNKVEEEYYYVFSSYDTANYLVIGDPEIFISY
ncbi:hypothetical protein HAHI6034_04385 [Hathewaya histolytica]|uniref:hypothetical protein n=1 Tax=Hathewaya histolytica TaxID=1498 RepID=UPI0039F0874D